MEFLFSSMFLYEYDVESIIKASEKAGYDGIEFWVETPHFWINRDSELLKPYKDKILALHAPVLDLNPVSVNEEVCELTLKETLSSISLAKKLGRKIVTVHAGKRSAAREPVWEDYASLERYLRVSSNYSRIKGVRLCLENSEPGINYLCKTADEVEDMVKKFNLKITFDINHAVKNSFGEAKKFLELVEKMENVHVSGYDSKGRHVSAIGFKDIKEILTDLKELGYDGKVTVELDDLGMGKLKRELDYESKVEILRKELNYLKSVLG